MTDKHFIDWEHEVFGFGYGTGEQHTLGALKSFIEYCNEGEYKHAYDYERIEKALTPAVAWLMINILCKADILDYGTSPRYGWLSEKGEILKTYVEMRSADELYNLTSVDQDYHHCYKDHCNCESPCDNPLFPRIEETTR